MIRSGDVVTPDSKGRVNLGKLVEPNSPYEITKTMTGGFILTPVKKEVR